MTELATPPAADPAPDPAPATPPAPAAAAPPTPPATPPTGEPPKPPAAPAATPTPEVKYDLKLPDNPTLDAQAPERIAAFARSRGLSPEHAQQALEFVNTEVAQYLDRESQAHTAQVETWKTETLADPQLGSTPAERQAALKRGESVIDAFGKTNPEDAKALKEFLNASGYGNNKSVARFMAWFGKMGAESKLILPGASDTPADTSREAEYRKMFPKSYDAMVGTKT